MINPLLIGAAAGVLGDEAGDKLDRMRGKPEHPLLGSTLHGDIIEIRRDLDIIAKYYKAADESAIDTVATLQTDPLRYRLNTHGRKYNQIFVPNSSTQITANIPGMGTVSFIPSTGWTSLDFKNGTELYLTSGNQQNVLIRVTNTTIGNTFGTSSGTNSSASATGTITSVAGAASSTQLLAANTLRKGAYFFNDSTAILYLAFAASASTTAYTTQVPANWFFEMPTSPVYTGVIFGIWGSATGNVRITEMS